ncbi:MAG TPA: hypothetical protein VJC39_04530 [Candidatus Nanoarchaeia archaeon]|nr:hypothetical protein [Candidatus Nanoarchaeia archaeon]
MDLTIEQISVLRILVEKETEAVKKEGKKIGLSNSPFLNKVDLDESDLPFLKSETKYLSFLKELARNL